MRYKSNLKKIEIYYKDIPSLNRLKTILEQLLNTLEDLMEKRWMKDNLALMNLDFW